MELHCIVLTFTILISYACSFAIVPLADRLRKPWKWVESNYEIIVIDFDHLYKQLQIFIFIYFVLI